MITRRRFLAINAVALGGLSAGPGSFAKAVGQDAKVVWQGRAFGADVQISLGGDRSKASAALEAARDTIRRMEHYFSIYDPSSLLSVLNRNGRLSMPPEFARLISSVEQVHEATGALFDPTIQPLFSAYLRSRMAPSAAELKQLGGLIGWQKVTIAANRLRFSKPGMAITLNGIAQGFATDRVSEVLVAHGFEVSLVNIGEYRSSKSPTQLAVEDVAGHQLGHIYMESGAVATSSADGFLLGGGVSHILFPNGNSDGVHWRTASVCADSATIADGVSTALLLAPDTKIAQSLVDTQLIRSVILQSQAGQIIRL